VTIYLVIPLLVVVAVLQTTVVSHLTIWGVFADLPLLLVVSWGLLRGTREGMVWGFVGGLVVDLLSAAPFGAASLSLLAVGFLSGLGKATVFRAHVALPLVTVFLATIVYDLIFLFVLQISGQTVTWLSSLFRIALPSAALNAVLTPVVFGMMRWLYTRFGREEVEL
jgi:rod shape-determining protein MreD